MRLSEIKDIPSLKASIYGILNFYGFTTDGDCVILEMNEGLLIRFNEALKIEPSIRIPIEIKINKTGEFEERVFLNKVEYGLKKYLYDKGHLHEKP